MSVTNNHNKSPLSLATSVCSNITSVSLFRLSFRISLAVLKARSTPADVAGIGLIKCDSCILYRLGRCDLFSFQKFKTLVPIENKYILMSKLSGNCVTNCEFQLQLVHSQLQLQLQLGKNAYLINYNYNYLTN